MLHFDWPLSQLRSVPVRITMVPVAWLPQKKVLVCDDGDVFCPSGRAGFSPNPRAPRQGSPSLLITAPLLTPPHSDLLSAQTHRPVTGKQASTKHQHINCRALRQISLRELHIPQTFSRLSRHMSMLGEGFWCPVETYRLRQQLTNTNRHCERQERSMTPTNRKT